jgi:hypothetical protein
MRLDDGHNAEVKAVVTYEPPRVINRIDIAASLMPPPVSI